MIDAGLFMVVASLLAIPFSNIVLNTKAPPDVKLLSWITGHICYTDSGTSVRYGYVSNCQIRLNFKSITRGHRKNIIFLIIFIYFVR